jgi:hypothetical protein
MGMHPNTCDTKSDGIIDEALALAFMTTRLLVAWHSGKTDAQDSMHLLWDGFCKIIRSDSVLKPERDETQPSSHRAGTAPSNGLVRPPGPRRP